MYSCIIPLSGADHHFIPMSYSHKSPQSSNQKTLYIEFTVLIDCVLSMTIQNILTYFMTVRPSLVKPKTIKFVFAVSLLYEALLVQYQI
jgi:hypothetical protein